ncbi:MAG: 30S ribosomal protein S7 [bacterium]
MPRNPKKVEKRILLPDAKYNSVLVTKFINKIMLDGKKSLAQRLVYSAIDEAGKKVNKEGLEVFETAIKNVSPVLQVKSRRIGGATYQVPMEVKGDRRLHYAFAWVRDAARKRSGLSFDKALAIELADSYNNVGTAIKKREDTHKMAEANKAFAHFARY